MAFDSLMPFYYSMTNSLELKIEVIEMLMDAEALGMFKLTICKRRNALAGSATPKGLKYHRRQLKRQNSSLDQKKHSQYVAMSRKEVVGLSLSKSIIKKHLCEDKCRGFTKKWKPLVHYSRIVESKQDTACQIGWR